MTGLKWQPCFCVHRSDIDQSVSRLIPLRFVLTVPRLLAGAGGPAPPAYGEIIHASREMATPTRKAAGIMAVRASRVQSSQSRPDTAARSGARPRRCLRATRIHALPRLTGDRRPISPSPGAECPIRSASLPDLGVQIGLLQDPPPEVSLTGARHGRRDQGVARQPFEEIAVLRGIRGRFDAPRLRHRVHVRHER